MKLIFLLLLIHSASFARWATKSDLDYSLLKESSEYKVKKNGTYELIQIMEYELLKDSAKSKFGIHKIPYHSNTSKVSLIEATVTNGNLVTKVNKEQIVNRSVSTNNGIDDTNEIQISLPNLQVNSKIFIKYKMVVEKVVVLGHFSVSHQIGESGQADESVVKIETELPLHIFKNDPYNSIEITDEKKKNGIQHIFVKLKAPYQKHIVEEHALLNAKKQVYFKFSSHQDWTAIGQSFQKRFENVLAQKLPKDFERIVNEAKALNTVEEKVNHILSYITQTYNYVGDWRTLDGKFSPRNLNDIAATKYGDCKDFATILTALLRKQGLKADVATVFRSNVAIAKSLHYELPTLDVMNHAIVRLKVDNKTYWLDPTNEVSFGLNHRADISAAKALPLDGVFSLEQIPETNPHPNRITINKTVTFDSSDTGKVTSNIELNGSQALAFAGAQLKLTKDKLDEAFVTLLSHGEKAIVPTISPYDLSTKKYTPLNIKIDYTASNLSYDQEGQKFAKLPDMGRFIYVLGLDVKKWEGDLFLGETMTFERTTTMKGVFAQKRLKGCNISTDWLDLERAYEYTADGIIQKEKLAIKQSIIPSEKYATTDFELLQYNVSDCLTDKMVSFSFENRKHAESEAKIEEGFAKLPLKERIQKRYEFVKQIEDKKIKSSLSDSDLAFFLKKNNQEDPTHIKSFQLHAHLVLSSGYLNGENYNMANVLAAKNIILEGLKTNPQSPGLQLDHARIVYFSGDKETARKMFESIQGLETHQDSYDFITLGNMYRRMGERDKIEPAYENALKYAKNDTERSSVWFARAHTKSLLNDNEGCIAAYDEVLKHNPKDSYTHINVVSCLIGAKKFDEAVERAKAGRLITQAGMMKIVSSDALISRGEYYLREKKYDLAENDFKESLQFNSNPYAFGFLAYIAAKKKDFNMAFSLLKSGAQASEKDVGEFYVKFIYVFDESPEHTLRLMKAAFDESHLIQNKLWANYYIGYTLLKMGKKPELAAFLKSAIRYADAVDPLEKNNHSVMNAIMNTKSLEFQMDPTKSNVIIMNNRAPASVKIEALPEK